MNEPPPRQPVEPSAQLRNMPWGCIIPLVLVGALVAWLIPAVQHAREAARHTQCRGHYAQIRFAFENYHDVYGRFPPAYVADADGKPIHSWRVLILPFIDGNDLYKKYDFSEPWNGPNNRRLLTERRSIFHCPSGANASENNQHQLCGRHGSRNGISRT